MKKAVIALIRDIDKGEQHLESLPSLFDCAESVDIFAQHRLNKLVTIVVKTVEVEVEDEVKLVSWI